MPTGQDAAGTEANPKITPTSGFSRRACSTRCGPGRTRRTGRWLRCVPPRGDLGRPPIWGGSGRLPAGRESAAHPDRGAGGAGGGAAWALPRASAAASGPAFGLGRWRRRPVRGLQCVRVRLAIAARWWSTSASAIVASPAEATNTIGGMASPCRSSLGRSRPLRSGLRVDGPAQWLFMPASFDRESEDRLCASTASACTQARRRLARVPVGQRRAGDASRLAVN